MTRSIKIDQVAEALSTVPGVQVEMLSAVPSGAQDITSATFADIDSNLSNTFNASVSASYFITFTMSMWGSGSAGLGVQRLVFDAGTGDEQIIGEDDIRWGINFDASMISALDTVFKTVTAAVNLTAGSHTLKVQWRTDGTLTANVDAPYNSFVVNAVAVTGSGAGGTIATAMTMTDPVTLAAISTDYLIATADINAIDGEAININYTGNVKDGGTDIISWYTLVIKVDGVDYNATVYSRKEGSVGVAKRFNASFSETIIGLVAGEHTIAIYARTESSHADFTGILENNDATIIQYRGGLVPIQQDGVDKIATPRALNFVGAGMVTDVEGIATIELNSAITAIGDTIVISDGAPNTQIDVTTAYTKIMPEDEASMPFITSVSGIYEAQFTLDFLGSTGDAASGKFKVVFDLGESNEQTIGDSELWQSRAATDSYSSPVFSALLTLSAGAHTVTAYCKATEGDDIRIIALYPVQPPILILRAVTGSGAGGVLVDEATKSSSQAISVGTETKITGLDLAFDTQDETVEISYEINTSSGSATLNTRMLYIRVDGGSWEALTFEYGSYGCQFMGTHNKDLTSGSHTVEFGFECDEVTTTVYGGDTAIFGYYPTSKVWVSRFRGGLVPIRKDGATVIDKPAALNFIGSNISISSAGGTANIDINFDNLAAGAQTVSATIPSDYTLTSSWADTGHSVDFTAVEGETVLLSFLGRFSRDAADVNPSLGYVLDSDSVVTLASEWLPSTDTTEAVCAFFPVTGLSIGGHTIKLQAVASVGSGFLKGHTSLTPSQLSVTQFRGGFVQPDNVPYFERDASDESLINTIQAPGASGQFSLVLNNGVRYTAPTTISCDLDTTGEGGRDNSEGAVTATLYNIFAVNDTVTDGQFALVASKATSEDGPPDHQTAFRYMWTIHVDTIGPTVIGLFTQAGDWYFSNSHTDAINHFFDAGVTTVTANTWYDLDTVTGPVVTALGDIVPLAIADKIQFNGFLDLDVDASGQTVQFGIAGGNPPASSASDSGITVLAAKSPASGEDEDAGIFDIPIIDGGMSYAWRSFSTSGTPTVEVDLWVRGYRNALYPGNRAGAQLQTKYVPDTKSLKGTWVTGTTVDFSSRPGQPSTVLQTFSDGLQRTASGTLNWDDSNNVADLGWDEAGSQAAGDKMIYFYEVPSAADNMVLTIRASDNPTSVGPTGYTKWKLVYASFRESGALWNVRQIGNRFEHTQRLLSSKTATFAKETLALGSYIPESAGEMLVKVYVQVNSSGWAKIRLHIYGDTLYFSDLTSGLPWSVAEDRGAIPTPGTPKQIEWEGIAGLGGNINSALCRCNGWIDEWIDP